MSLQLSVINRIHDVAILELPPGTIIAWIPGADEQLPNRWQICDGSEITEGNWKGKNTPDLTHAFLVGAAKVAVDVGSGGPREFNPPVEPGVVYAEFEQTDMKTFCSSYTASGATLSCNDERLTAFTNSPKLDVSNLQDENGEPYDPSAYDNLPIYEVVYIMRVR